MGKRITFIGREDLPKPGVMHEDGLDMSLFLGYLVMQCRGSSVGRAGD